MYFYEHKNISTIVKRTKCVNLNIDCIVPALDGFPVELEPG